MTTRIWISAPVAAAFALTSPAFGADYLASVTSEVFVTAGTPKEIATRANRCIAQHLAPGRTDAALIISSDLGGGIIVARNAISEGGLTNMPLRSTFTFEAREGRFRITQTNIERFNDMFGGWGPVGKWAGSNAKKVEQRFVASANLVAQCVMAGSAAENW